MPRDEPSREPVTIVGPFGAQHAGERSDPERSDHLTLVAEGKAAQTRRDGGDEVVVNGMFVYRRSELRC